ncbi:MAG: carboxymuconolactone decarboxylase family protein [Hyphomicrobiaceae bacterium]|nr:carboxymuconolactone decarboxylase family protein [Hyphomicrobiaceae bacterium]
MSREQLRRRGEAVRRELGLDRKPNAEPLPGFDDFLAEVAYGGIWDRPGLSRPDRMLCTLAVLGLYQRLPQLEAFVPAALDTGIEPRAILEVFMQAGLYGGFVTTETAADLAQRVFAARGIKVPSEPARSDSEETLDRRGKDLMATLHGDRGRQGYAAPGNPITGALYPSAIRYGYGELWFREGLADRQRMLVAIASFTALGLDSQLAKFAQSALNVGLSTDEIVEAVIQTGPYSGFPRALNGLAILSGVF